MTNDDKIINEFKRNRDDYVKVDQIAYDKIMDEVKKKNYFIMDVMHRVKDVDSLAGKINRKSGKYSDLLEITDLCGFRIICFFSDTVDAIAKSLEDVFEFDRENTVDKRASLQATQFGYLSLHCICKLRAEDGIDERLTKISFEIQIRTVLQHAWAEIEHDLGYKSDFGVPSPIRRNFSRVASLLEIADREFIGLRDDSIEYTETIRDKIANDDCDDVEIDGPSFKEFIKHNKSIIAFTQRLRDELALEITYIESKNPIKQLKFLNVEKLGSLIELLENNKEYAYNAIKKIVDEYAIDIMSSMVMINNLCEGELIRNNYSDEQIRQFVGITVIDRAKAEKNAKRIMALRDEYNNA